ncbi:MAG: hypothetical protein MUQ42_01835, partial [OM182 bacterium]|nr:hypothetical protein [OM182 bacterium]
VFRRRLEPASQRSFYFSRYFSGCYSGHSSSYYPGYYPGYLVGSAETEPRSNQDPTKIEIAD